MAIFAIYVKFLAVVSLELYFCKPFFLSSFKKDALFCFSKGLFHQWRSTCTNPFIVDSQAFIGYIGISPFKGLLGGLYKQQGYHAKGTTIFLMKNTPILLKLWRYRYHPWNLEKRPGPKRKCHLPTIDVQGRTVGFHGKIHFVAQILKAPKPTSFQWTEIMKNNNEKKNRNGFSQGGPLAVINGLITPINGLIKWLTVLITLVIGVVNPVITGRGPTLPPPKKNLPTSWFRSRVPPWGMWI